MKNALRIELDQAQIARQALLSFGMLLLVYTPVLVDLVADWWNDPNYSHGFLVPVVSGYLLWKKRDRLPAAVGRSSKSGLLMLVAALILFVVGSAGAEYFTVRVSFVVALTGLTLYHFGASFLRQVWFELGFLLFMIPLPYVIYYSLTAPLQLFATKISIKALAVIGVPAVREGNIIHLSGISLEVAEACSGIRSMLSLLALGAMFSYFSQKSALKRSVLFLSTIPITIATNSARVFVTAVMAFTTDLEVTADPLHSLLGFSVFIMAFVMLFIFNALLGKIPSSKP